MESSTPVPERSRRSPEEPLRRADLAIQNAREIIQNYGVVLIHLSQTRHAAPLPARRLAAANSSPLPAIEIFSKPLR